MAIQSPIVLASGFFSQLFPGDTVPGTDTTAQASGNAGISTGLTALASGNAGISTGLTALASGNAGISTGLTALASGNAGISIGLTALASGNDALSLANLKLPLSGGVLTGDVILDNQVDVRFREATASGVNYVGFQAPANIVSDIIFTLPNSGPTIPGYALKSDSFGVLSWGNAGGATGSGTDDIFYENSRTVTGSYTLTANKNAVTAGPVTINSGVTVTIPSGSAWVVV
jgi:hypothetical protein